MLSLFKRFKRNQAPVFSTVPPNVPHFPIQFAFPIAKIPAFQEKKQFDFSDLAPQPGRHKKYLCHDEQTYYRQLNRAYFAITTRKAGWDCLRHYEIVASGCVPYFIDIEQCPEGTLVNWPKDLLASVFTLPGLPAPKKVAIALKKRRLAFLRIDHAIFDLARYRSIQTQLQQHFHQYLTTAALSKYVLNVLGNPKRIVLFYGISRGCLVDYMRDLLIIGLAESADVELMVYPNPVWLLRTCPRDLVLSLTGKGFTSTRCLSASDYRSLTWASTKQLLDEGFFESLIACSSSNQGFEALPLEVQASLAPRRDVVWVDGSDALFSEHAVPACARLVFRREYRTSGHADHRDAW